MRRILFLSSIIVTLLVSSCQGEKLEGILWSRDASTLIKEGICLTHVEAEVNMKFTSIFSDISVSSSESWIDASVSLIEGNGELTIRVSENPGILSRRGDVVVSALDQSTIIHITQEGVPFVVPEKDSYYHHHEKGEITIKVQTNSLPDVEIYPKNVNWIKVDEVSSTGENEYAVTLILEKNEGLGRIASLDFKINGQPINQNCGPCIIQEPAPFEENVEISVDNPGYLQILLGNNVNNLRDIRFLKLIGPINGLDFPIIKSLFSEQDRSYDISVDLSECVIVAGDKNPFEYYGWKPLERYEDIFLYGEIPSNVFTNAVNLKEIILPKELKIIGASAFEGCKNLKKIIIPNSVEEINRKAFYNCLGIEELQINDESNLSSIGNQAFTTKSLLKDLTIPITVTNISSEAFLGCSVSHLHLRWPEPFEVKIVPQTEGCSLFVPKGTAELYRNTRNWYKFKEIIEE